MWFVTIRQKDGDSRYLSITFAKETIAFTIIKINAEYNWRNLYFLSPSYNIKKNHSQRQVCFMLLPIFHHNHSLLHNNGTDSSFSL